MIYVTRGQCGTYLKMRGMIRQLLREIRAKDKKIRKLKTEYRRLIDREAREES